jgi:hypothetical protein
VPMGQNSTTSRQWANGRNLTTAAWARARLTNLWTHSTILSRGTHSTILSKPTSQTPHHWRLPSEGASVADSPLDWDSHHLIRISAIIGRRTRTAYPLLNCPRIAYRMIPLLASGLHLRTRRPMPGLHQTVVTGGDRPESRSCNRIRQDLNFAVGRGVEEQGHGGKGGILKVRKG